LGGNGRALGLGLDLCGGVCGHGKDGKDGVEYEDGMELGVLEGGLSGLVV